MAFTTVPDDQSRGIIYELDNIHLAFPVATNKIFPIGASVALNNSGLIDTPTSSEQVLGQVYIQKQKDNQITVKTSFTMVIEGRAKVPIACGVLLIEVFADTALNQKPTFQPAVTGQLATHRALQGVSANDFLQVGVLSGPIMKS